MFPTVDIGICFDRLSFVFIKPFINNSMIKTYKGKYSLKHPEKYQGDPTNVIFRSSWELKVFRWCDLHSKVISWSSEEDPIPYRSPIDGKIHRYFPDLLITIRDKYNVEKTFLVEVKPKSQTQLPKKKMSKGRPSKRYLQEVQNYAINQAKWESAQQVCAKRGWEWKIITEDEIKAF